MVVVFGLGNRDQQQMTIIGLGQMDTQLSGDGGAAVTAVPNDPLHIYPTATPVTQAPAIQPTDHPGLG